MRSQKIEPAGAEETLSAKCATQIPGNWIVLSPVDPFYDLYLTYGGMKNALELYKRLNQPSSSGIR